MNIVDLMQDVRWTEADVVNRMEAHIHGTYPPAEELILLRKLIGALAGAVLFGGQGYRLTPEELQEVMAYQAVCVEAQSLGRQARADMAVLERVLDAESGAAELAEDDTTARELLAARAAARPAEEPVVNEGNNDGQESTVPADGTPAGA